MRTSQLDPCCRFRRRLPGDGDDLIRALQRRGPQAPAAEVMRRDISLVRQDASLEEAFRLMEECQCPALAVVDPWGQLVGIITPENVGELMMVRSAAY